jgi:hypothetical protein
MVVRKGHFSAKNGFLALLYNQLRFHKDADPIVQTRVKFARALLLIKVTCGEFLIAISDLCQILISTFANVSFGAYCPVPHG